ncbi:hypothetical protein K2173_000181 [Erythroxylum novogranatense]|uniref:Uncharacterized protein n=1 Tax=Erythroxylum novogranatense TaxID=1862640 RepID=A0AAV8SNR9_9ROSI|nr:hypothetical protein K2173_000181 [Erythroxylum novogranatense]
MADQPSNNPVLAIAMGKAMESPVVVIGPQFLTENPVDLTISSKIVTLGESDFSVSDANGTLIFRVKSKLASIRDVRHLKDAAGNTLVTLKQKIRTIHRRWQAFRGDSMDDKDLLFSVKKSSVFQFKTQLDVFLASNTSETAPNFKIKGNWLERSCTIYSGDGESNTIVAQMHKEHTVKTLALDSDKFGVTVSENVDYAFIVALVVVLNEINADRGGDGIFGEDD